MLSIRILIVVLLAGPALAGPASELSRAFADIDPSQVSTGILYDRALDMCGLESRNGSGEDPAVTAAAWRQMAHQMTLGSLTVPTWPDVDALRQRTRNQIEAGLVPLGLLDFRYQRLRPEALAAGQAVLRDGRVDLAGPGALRTDRAFAAAVLAPRTHRGGSVRFVLPPGLMIGNATERPELTVDFGDGRGLRPLVPGVPVAVSYGSTGSKRIRLTARYSDGTELVSSTTLEVAALATPLPTEVWPLTASVPFDGSAATGEAYVYLAPGHTALTDPVVVVEGFDLDNTMGWDELYALLNTENLLEDLRARGYDAVVLDFTESTEPIQRNAMLLVELLQQVQAAQVDGRDLAVIGASMGGLVARYGLAWMEQQGVPHRARLYLSFDTPHGGANIPLGVQYWLQLFQIESSEAGFLLSRLDTPAARQMLLYHHTSPPGATGEADPLRGAFLADLAAAGDFPDLPRRVAVANGSGTGADQGYAAGDQLISYEYYSFLVDIIGNVWAVPDQAPGMILDGLINRIWPLSDDDLRVTVDGTRPLDNAPGGSRASLADMDSTAAPYGDIIALHSDHCFIPTVSAVGLPTTDPFFDIAALADLAAATPFDVVHVPDGNQPHVAVTPENKAWFLAVVEREASAVEPEGVSAVAGGVTARPNPFNPVTELDYVVPVRGPASLELFDARGRRVRVLAAGHHERGNHRAVWDGRDGAGRDLPSGVYLGRVRHARGQATARLTLVR